MESKILLSNGEVTTVSSLFKKDDFGRSKEGRDTFVRHDGLRTAAIKAFGGIKKRKTEVLSTPSKDNGFCSASIVSYTFGNGVQTSGAADCGYHSASRMCNKYTTQLAETRASARALRFALGLAMPAFDEIADIDSMINVESNYPAEKEQLAVIYKRFMKQKGKTLEDVGNILGRKLVTLKELTQADAAQVLEAFNSEPEDD